MKGGIDAGVGGWAIELFRRALSKISRNAVAFSHIQL